MKGCVKKNFSVPAARITLSPASHNLTRERVNSTERWPFSALRDVLQKLL
jgi:hypothetical protein